MKNSAISSQKRPARMTKRQKRIAIAKDVLSTLRYLNVKNRYAYISGEIFKDGKTEASKCLTELRKCEVCAIGAAMISHIKLFNKITLDELNWLYSNEYKFSADDGTIRDELSKYFDEQDIIDIECAFEGYFFCKQDANYSWNYKSYKPKERLSIIMKNIVKNGKFVKEQLPGYHLHESY